MICVHVRSHTLKQQKKITEKKTDSEVREARGKRQKGVILHLPGLNKSADLQEEVKDLHFGVEYNCTLCVIITNAHLHFHLKYNQQLNTSSSYLLSGNCLKSS